MNRTGREPAHQNDFDTGSADVRELFVTTDFRSIPVAELRSMYDSLTQWLSAVLRYKVVRSESQPRYAIELRRMVKGEAKHVPKRIIKHFDAIKAQLEPLNFTPSFYANVPAIGPYSSALMAMSRQDGEIHFFASQVVTQTDQSIDDEGHFEFTTWLSDKNSIVTSAPARLPRPHGGVDRMIVPSEDPAVVLKKHRKRLGKLEIQAVAPTDLFQRVESENLLQTSDLLRRGVIRPASPAEVARIRNDKRV